MKNRITFGLSNKPLIFEAPRLRLIAGLLSMVSFIPLSHAEDAFGSTSFIVDAHVHTAGIGAGSSGCFVSKELRDGYKFNFYLRAFGVTLEELETHGDGLVLQRLSKQIAASQTIDKAVVLAMDGVLTADLELDRDNTQVYIPNDFIAAETAKYDNLVFGASVNPYRPDAIERLHQVKANGAVLVKWIPAIMGIDPSDLALKPYYETLAALKLPLLTHVGQEKSFGHAEDQFGDPKRLELALSSGVVVIAAHIATTGKNDGEDNYDRLIPLFAKYPNLYTDISSLTQINKLGYLSRALKDGTFTERMVYGSDWPLQFFPLVSPWYHIGRAPIAGLWRASRSENQWDKDVRLKYAMGVPKAVFERSAKILGMLPNIQATSPAH
jgi:predicted TIM-barrel fold metal-dependent hydrolase